MKLTTTTVSKRELLPAGKTEAIHFDDEIPGFGLRIREAGSRSFVFQYKLGSKQRRMALGVATPETIAEARKTAAKLHARVKLGQDPASDKVEAQRQASETFGPSAEEFLDTLRERYRPGSFREIRRHLLLHAKPLHALPVARITLRDVADLISAVTKQSGAVTANRVRSSLSVLFSWLIQNGRVPANPVVNAGKNPEKSRDRVLSESELRSIWNCAGDDQYGAIIRLLMLTGQRANEVAGLRWSEIADGQIMLPAERTKNKRAHALPLSPAAAEIIAQQPVREGRDLVFGDGSGGFSGWSRCKERLDQHIARANGGKPLPDWTHHDLRRSTATHMAEIGVLPHIVEAVLNHVGGHKAGVAGVYNRAAYEKDKRDALIRWAEHLAAVVKGRPGKITPLRRA
ncbi:MAG: tyrosine-type recombinase/integrase [Xanthobacteraceae bacterium]